MITLKDKYEKKIAPQLKKQFGHKNVMQVPKLEKVVVARGVGEATTSSKAMDVAVAELANITGQKPLITRAKKSIAFFKTRKGMPIGCKVTLRGARMYHFMDKLINISLPRIRDFRGISPKSFDGHGNYTLGIKEQLIFPEVDYEKVDKIRGMDITICTTTKDNEEAKALLVSLGMPFQKKTGG